ncbi:MAG: hypothetical protein IID43_05515 [Planctomycetes bacterium]|nr:hypothetical protein [Planctomycetota bacterium]
MLRRSNARTRRCRIEVTLLLCASCLVATDVDAEDDPFGNTGTRWLLPLSQDEPGPSKQTDIPANASLFKVDINYTIYSDYIFRGINFSEFRGEGREKPNHQVDLSITADVASLFGEPEGTMGSLTIGTWFEWFAGQRKLDAVSGGQNLQEVDYTIAWSYDIEAIATSLTLGYVFYTFPNLDSINTQELQITLEHNDAWMWKWLLPDNEDGVLNPSFFYALDLEAAPGAGWMELGISHDFQVCTNVTMAPSLTLAIDNRWLDPILDTGRQGGTRLAYLQYGLNIAYDLSSGLKLPDELGAITMSGFLFFNEAFGNAESSGLIQDEFFGGMSIGWSF